MNVSRKHVGNARDKKELILVLAIIFSMISTLSGLSVACLIGSLIDNTNQLRLLLAVLGVILAVQLVGRYGVTILFNRYAVLMQSSLRRKAGESLAYMQAAVSGEQKTGDILTRASAEIDYVYRFYNDYFKQYIGGAVTIICGLTYLCMLSINLAVFMAAASAVIIIATLLLNRRIAAAHLAWRAAEADMSVSAEDIAAGHMDIKSMGIEKGVLSLFDRALRVWEDAFLHRNKVRAWNRLTSMLFSVLVFVGIPAYCANGIIQGTLTMGIVLTAVQITSMMADHLESVEHYAHTFTSFRINLQRVREIINMPGERSDGGVYKMSGGKTVVEMSEVGFAYNNKPVLNDFSITVDKGQTIAIVGLSGSGKSTVLKMIAGLYTPDKGTLRFGGYTEDSWNLYAMRGHMAYVQQDAHLFPGSVKDNLLCGEDYTDPELEDAIKQAGLSPWIENQPDGLDVQVGERGTLLSGGLRQRVTIARALLRKPVLMLLDEPTSALDEATEREVMDTIRRATEGITNIIVSHRLSSVTFADRIIAMRDGGIAEAGTHRELMDRKGYYYNLYIIQEKAECI